MNAATGSVRRRPGGRSARVRAAVLAAALDELAAGGTAGFSLDSVARRARVHRATVYRRWGSREALILEVMRARARENVPVPDAGNLRQDLIALAESAVENALANEPILRALVVELPHSPAVAEAARSFWRERLALDGQIVERAIGRGELGEGADARAIIEGVLGPLHFHMLITGETADKRTIARAVDLVINGLRRP